MLVNSGTNIVGVTNYLTVFKVVHSTRKKPMPENSQLANNLRLDRQILLTVQRKEYGSKVTPNDLLLYLQISVLLSHHQRSFFL